MKIVKASVAGAALIAAGVAVVTEAWSRSSGLPPIIRRPMGVVGLRMPRFDLQGALARYRTEAWATQQQRALLEEGVIDPKHFSASQFGL